MAKRQRLVVGDIVRIDLGDGLHAYARALDEPLMAFYSLRVGHDPPVEEIVSSNILFKIWVMNYAIKSGRWTSVGNLPLTNDLKAPVTFFKQDSLDPTRLSLYESAKNTPASLEQCRQHERAAVWEPEHVEDRLRDHFAGRPNKWVESLRVKEPAG